MPIQNAKKTEVNGVVEKKLFLAHSADLEKEIPPQSYYSHITGVREWKDTFVSQIREFLCKNEFFPLLEWALDMAVEWHDLGKLDDQFQDVLNGKVKGRAINHVEAGVVLFANKYNETKKFEYLIVSLLIRAHHIGYTNHHKIIGNGIVKSECLINKANMSAKYGVILDSFFDLHSCSNFGMNDLTVKDHVCANLETYIERHALAMNKTFNMDSIGFDQRLTEKFLKNHYWMRLALSILVDADHTDTGFHYDNRPNSRKYNDLMAKKLKKQQALNSQKIIKKISGNSKLKSDSTKRNSLRRRILEKCLEIDIGAHNFFIHSGMVGSGKTLSAFCFVNRVALKYGLNKIFFIEPFTALLD